MFLVRLPFGFSFLVMNSAPAMAVRNRIGWNHNTSRCAAGVIWRTVPFIDGE
jgi:hypothetical protein